ncbi:MAG TPA: PP2C family protein-serine/threonine phosphatase [Tepidisphaeraceae bacterium]|jgi:sigma-B regulation protein RsbU (phosphoserine phosphatase)
MHRTPKKFARKILLIHGLLLAGLIVLVGLMMAEVYHRSRQQAIDQTRARQALLASETASGIEQYYRSIFDDLDLFRRANEDETQSTSRPIATSDRFAQRAGPFRFGRLLWRQLDGRTSYLLVVNKNNPEPTRFLPDEISLPGQSLMQRKLDQQSHEARQATLRKMIEPAKGWLRNVTRPTIGPFEQLGGIDFNLIAVPVGGNDVLLAVVPAKTIQLKFIDPLNSQSAVGAWVLDEDGQVVSSFVQSSLEHDIKEHFGPQQMKVISAQIPPTGESTARIINARTNMDGVQIWPSIINIHPAIVGEKHWRVIVASPIAQTDRDVAVVFGRAMLWAIFVVISMSAILISTAIQLIRGRAKLRQIEHEILQREVKQARQIQLAWLPSRDHEADGIRLAAINQPANQISGDFYNWFDLPDGRMAVVIGDVTGHGMAAAFLMATTQLLIRTTLQRLGHAAEAMAEVNRQLCSVSHSGQFVTMLLIIVDQAGNEIEMIGAGHYMPLVGTNGQFKVIQAEPHFALGIDCEERYIPLRISLKEKTQLLLYTDGVLDAQNTSEEHFGVNNLLASAKSDAPRGMIDAIVVRVNQFITGRELIDDLTLLAVEIDTVSNANRKLRGAPGAIGIPVL